nr:MAG TPA: hypothetical protein [Caudoviricetes sp.]
MTCNLDFLKYKSSYMKDGFCFRIFTLTLL